MPQGTTAGRRIAVVTGAAGFLGAHLCRRLAARGDELRVLVHPSDDLTGLDGLRLMAVHGDIRSAADLDRVFAGISSGTDADAGADADITVYHLASRITIETRVDPAVRDVNVEGTRQVIDACRRHGARRLVYVSSVHAIPEPADASDAITEPDAFDPDAVIGGYAKTKAEATQLVLDANDGELATVAVMPSGIVGPGDRGGGYLTALVRDIASGSLTSYVDGGYDFVDVRDVADGCIAAAEKGRPGAAYILTSRRMNMDEIVRVCRTAVGKRTLKSVLPMWFARSVAPLAEGWYRLLRKPPLFTSYALHTLRSPGVFRTDRARADLGWEPKDPAESLRDVIRETTARG
ncbi:NAD-dependent epimerase/dehydratase family protein [Corynebacterium hansenii]|uniref:NAD-dependent epimerase/dehydratase family protein n=1 Tax=Corynebacterium hansenii TaxID=394964 RepID=A0ABV7ZVE6_9CORY|nr:NAD-dependent epimerase/dehydratase family protein [Corynebacterium hansenii]WJY99809.1 3 beta-hydroxysteroid dehydrogenase/Delta 5-->4-isomerase [Corynebacterium hansenii]